MTFTPSAQFIPNTFSAVMLHNAFRGSEGALDAITPFKPPLSPPHHHRPRLIYITQKTIWLNLLVMTQ